MDDFAETGLEKALDRTQKDIILATKVGRYDLQHLIFYPEIRILQELSSEVLVQLKELTTWILFELHDIVVCDKTDSCMPFWIREVSAIGRRGFIGSRACTRQVFGTIGREV